jgi:hypothetical protein
VTHAISVARCYVPETWGWGFIKATTCAKLIRTMQTGAKEWRLQLRLPPIYCVQLHLGRSTGDFSLDVPGVGSLDEVRCPTAVYGTQPRPDLRLRFSRWLGKSAGTVSLTALGGTRTRLIVNANMDEAWIGIGTCRKHPHSRLFTLAPFYSFRSDTTIRVSLDSLLRTPHVVLVDAGGAHGGDPLACAAIQRP